MQIDREIAIQFARDAGGGLSCIAEPLEHPWKFSEAELVRLVSIVAQHAAEAQRETCAQTAMLVAKNGIETSSAIRALGITKEQA